MRTVNPISLLVVVLLATPAAAGTPKRNSKSSKGGEKQMTTMILSSKAFENGASIPKKHTCQGADVSVPLHWTGIPKSAKSLVLIVDDPDAPDPKAPKMVWGHWVLYNMPPETVALDEGVASLPKGTLEGLNDWKKTGWRGPCPPIGKHRYFFKLYALSERLPDLKLPTKETVLSAMKGKILAEVELMGTYQK
jgi:Raf kinase inhibitor-like YbhB/YbcL family protein